MSVSKKMVACAFCKSKLIPLVTCTAVIVITVLSGCRADKAKPAVVIGNIKTNNSISISLCGLMTFNDHGVDRPVQGNFTITAVPITWNGTMFYGSCYEDDRNTIADEIHGTISADGQWVDTIQFSQQRTGISMMGIVYTITLKNIPVSMINSANQTFITGEFSRAGDVKKFVSKIEYTNWGVRYIETDWNNVAWPPFLSVTFSPNAGQSRPFSPGLNMQM